MGLYIYFKFCNTIDSIELNDLVIYTWNRLILILMDLIYFYFSFYNIDVILQLKATLERIKREQSRTEMVLNGDKLLFPVEKFKNPLLKYRFFIKYGDEINWKCYTQLDQKGMDRIMRYLTKELQSSPFLPLLKEEIMRVRKRFLKYFTFYYKCVKL